MEFQTSLGLKSHDILRYVPILLILTEVTEEMEEYDRQQRESLVRRHYDESPEIFECFLDQKMNYSTAFYPDSTTSLDDAQLIKLEKYAGWLNASEGGSYLDVGCGWGALSLHLAAIPAVKQVVGLTLSPNQAQYAHQRAIRGELTHKVSFHVQPFLEYAVPPEHFDGVSFIGSIVHMKERPEILQQVAYGLRPQGRLVISETYLPDHRGRGMGSRSSRYILEEIFGYSHPTTLSDELAALEGAGLRVLQVEHSTEHYLRTLEQWLGRLKASRARMEAIQPGEYRRLRKYLTLGHASFQQGTMLQYEIVAERT